MKNYKCSVALLSLGTLLQMLGCTKSAPTARDSKLTFNYNGKKYELSGRVGAGNWGKINQGIYIDRPDIFNGKVYFTNDRCAYLEPPNRSIQPNIDCQLTSAGSPIDSNEVYIYSSGSVSILYSNCRSFSGTTSWTGPYTHTYCDAQGTFDLILKNKENKTIIITDGKIEGYEILN